MAFNIKRHSLLLIIKLVAISAVSALTAYLLIQDGMSAQIIALTFILILLFYSVYNALEQQDLRLQSIFTALANGENNLGLNNGHPLRSQYDDIKNKIQSARLKAEQQANFLQAVLRHGEIAILVFDEQGKVVEHNPASTRLLGFSPRHVNELGQLGKFITCTNNACKTIIPWLRGEQQDSLSLGLSLADIQGVTIKVINLQSIHNDLQREQQLAYQKLTTVLTHEVANSITPLSSLAEICLHFIPEQLIFDQEKKQDLQLALQSIASRTAHLNDFIQRFREISALPKPDLSPVKLGKLIKNMMPLYQESERSYGVKLNYDIQSDGMVLADQSQIEQILINLVQNALDMFADREQENKKQINITLATNSSQQVYLQVTDNGPGLAEHALDMAFVPFFSTKQNGSGIGLSLSKQIMINHGGDLVYIKNQQGACFRCLFG